MSARVIRRSAAVLAIGAGFVVGGLSLTSGHTTMQASSTCAVGAVSKSFSVASIPATSAIGGAQNAVSRTCAVTH